MNRQEEIKYLENFLDIVHRALDKDRSASLQEEEREMSKRWGVVKEIFLSLDYDLGVKQKNNQNSSIEGTNSDIFFDGVVTSANTHVRRSSLRKLQSLTSGAIGQLEVNVKRSVKGILPDISTLIGVLNTFPDIVSRMTHRRAGKDSFEIKDEYDVQDILYTMLKGTFQTLQYEDSTPKQGVGSYRVDFSINDLKTFIEVKIIKQKSDIKKVQDECLTDIQAYGSQDICEKIIFFIYDPNNFIDNKFSFVAMLQESSKIGDKDIDIIALLPN